MLRIDMTVFLACCALMALATVAPAEEPAAPSALAWPAVTRTMRPWTRWWWPGSAVDRPNLTHLLETYHAAGLGGVEITPIYGVQGQEAREISYLSPAWLEMLHHTLSEAQRLDMGVDMPTGTGWPFGGPTVTDVDALDKLVLHEEALPGGKPLERDYGAQHPEALVAVSGQGQQSALLEKIDAQGHLAWTPPAGDWTLYTVSIRWSGRRVKRAAPGGAGKCINPFVRQSLQDYLQRFDTALAGLPPGAIRCQFHDSFEYATDWAPTLFDTFQARRGYDLRDHLPALAGKAAPDEVARVRTDYHEAVSEMLLENFTQPWTAWAHSKGSLSRYQAHGSPGNLLDLYAAADIPETEIFNHLGDPRLSKFASSAAHLLGKPLASSESCTWLDEHFTVTLGKARTALDRLLVSGINHILYHGTAYSPQDAAWPGWLFYASTDFTPNDPIWHDFPALNAYITRCQSILQSGHPDNDVLLYWPLHDLWQKTTFFGLTIEGKWLTEQPIGATAQTLWDQGFAYDYISDHQLALVHATPEGLRLPGGAYRVILVPPCDFMPLDTLKTLHTLAEAGATVLFHDHLPQEVPGLGDLAARRKAFHALLDGLPLTATATAGVRQAKIGAGRFLVGADLKGLLALAQVRREPIADHPGVYVIRRTRPDGHHYFLVNEGQDSIDGWVDLAVPARSVVLMDPMTGHTGVARAQPSGNGPTRVYLQLSPGGSLLLRTFTSEVVKGPAWRYWAPAGASVALTGKWQVRFLAGGPELPPPFATTELASWTTLEGVEAQRFAGTARYTLTFDAPPGHAETWMLDLGDVRETARVLLNGQEAGTLLGRPFCLPLGHLKRTGNVLEIDVTNLAANRIRDMDRRKVPWKIFQEINFVDIHYRPFDASNWPIADSGLLGPVHLTPLKSL